ncbi:thiolase family protein [Rhodococcus sp. 2H158]
MSLENVVIAGVHATPQAKQLPGRTSTDLALEAIHGALADAGLGIDDVDGIAVEWLGDGGLRGHDGASWARLLGRPMAWTSDGMFDSSGPRGILKAAAAIQAGLCSVAVVGGGQVARRVGSEPIGVSEVLEFTDHTGAYVMSQFALVAQRHMHEFGTTPEQLATIAATIRNHGHVNPEAVMFGRGPYTAEDVLASRMISTPLHLLDCCLVAEGGAAVVLTSAERAADLDSTPVRILGGGMHVTDPHYTQPPRLERTGWLGQSAIDRAFRMADCTPADIDAFMLYDATSFEVLRQVEMLGLCERGEGGAYCTPDTIGLGGSTPVNPDGGLLSHSWLGAQQMTLKVIEAVRQLRGTAVNQVADVELAMAGASASATHHYECVVLGHDN